MKLKSDNIEITLGLLCDLEQIIGDTGIKELTTGGSTDVTASQKRSLLMLLGYTEAQANRAPIELVETELSVFFSRWLEKSVEGKLRSLSSQPSGTKSVQRKKRSRTASTNKPSSQKTGRTRR